MIQKNLRPGGVVDCLSKNITGHFREFGGGMFFSASPLPFAAAALSLLPPLAPPPPHVIYCIGMHLSFYYVMLRTIWKFMIGLSTLLQSILRKTNLPLPCAMRIISLRMCVQ